MTTSEKNQPNVRETEDDGEDTIMRIKIITINV
jgi:hypothetical protein